MEITPKSIIKDVLPLLKSSNTNSLKGFTLAEILISLMILGVIASLTIPSLIQNTHKKEEIVQVKKALSMMDQALKMEYAATGKNYFEAIEEDGDHLKLFKKYLSIVGSYGADIFENAVIITQDGIGIVDIEHYDPDMVVFAVDTKPSSKSLTKGISYMCNDHVYYITCDAYKCYAEKDTCTGVSINAKDPTKVKYNNGWVEE